MNYSHFTLGFFLFVLGQIVAWFQLNGQFLWESWRGRPLYAMLLAPVTGYLFWYAWKIISGCTDSVWSARFVGFGASYLVFPVLTYFLLGEGMWSFKTMSCVVLSIVILLIQIYG